MNLIDTGIDKGLIRFDENRDFITYVFQTKSGISVFSVNCRKNETKKRHSNI
jgi:hypothetical protein